VVDRAKDFEAVTAGTLAVGDQFVLAGATRNIKANRWHVQAMGDGTVVFAPERGGRCYPVAYCLGEGREAILRTAAWRAARP
jgi:hypothetical protein